MRSAFIRTVASLQQRPLIPAWAVALRPRSWGGLRRAVSICRPAVGTRVATFKRMSLAQIPDGSFAIPRQSSFRLLAVFVATVAVCAGCVAPAPVLRLTPRSDNVLWVGGMAAIIKQGKSARVAVAFARQEEELISFRVEIENTGLIPILVDPSSSYYATCTRSAKNGARQCHPTRWVFNPEEVLLDLDIAHSRQKADQMNREAFAGPMLLLTIQSESQEQASTYEIARVNWETEALRKTTLLPGNGVAGLVYVSRDLAANEVLLQIRIGDEVLGFPFNQTLINARRPRTTKDMSTNANWRGD